MPLRRQADPTPRPRHDPRSGTRGARNPSAACRKRTARGGDPAHPLDVGGRRPAPPRAVRFRRAAEGFGRRACRCEDRLEAVEWDQLADEEARERLARATSPGGRAAPRRRRSRPRRVRIERAASARWSAFALVSATTRWPREAPSGRSRVSARAASEPGWNRPRSATNVSASETSGLKTTGRLPAARRAAGRSKWPG